MRRTHLHCNEGTSDKTYTIEVFEDDTKGGWVVNFNYGKRNGSQTFGTKTQEGGVEYDRAISIADKLINQKKKGKSGGSIYKQVNEEAVMSPEYKKSLTLMAAEMSINQVFTAEQYNRIKGLLLSPDMMNQNLAETLLQEKSKELRGAV